MVQLLDTEEDNVISAIIRSKISKNDIEKIHPHIQTIVGKGNRVDFLFEMENVHGYEPEGLWADLKVDSTHISYHRK